MYIPFEKLPSHSRVWVYQADRVLSSLDKTIISERLKAFTENWQVHGQDMETSFDIRFDQFVILAANDTASGCSIDSSVRVIRDLGDSLGIDFFNRTQVAFQITGAVRLIATSDMKSTYQDKRWATDTLMFNNLVDTKSKLENDWLVPAGSTWVKRYIPQPTVAS